MQRDSIKTTITAVWVSAVSAVGIAGNMRSVSGWAVLAGLATIPPLIMMWRWNDPSQTMSEAIQEARR
jgi:hypothetical protein